MTETSTSRATLFMTNAATLLLVAGIAFGVFILGSALDGPFAAATSWPSTKR